MKFKDNTEEMLLQSEKEGVEPYQMRYRWVMLILAWLMYVAFGVAARSVAPLVTPILKDLNVSYSQMGIIMGSWPLTYILVALIAGAVIDRWGIRKSLFVGGIIIGLSEILRYFVGGFTSMFLCVALFGVGGPMISVGCPKAISVWFRGKERGTAVGVYTAGPWIGGLVAYSTANSIVMPLTGYSWRLTFVCYGLLVWVVALLWWFLAKDVRPSKTTESASVVKVFSSLISVRNIQLIIVMGFLAFAVGHGFNDWIPKILEIGGLSPVLAGFAASLPLLVGIPTRLIVPHFAAIRLRVRILVLASLMIAIALVIISAGSGSWLITGLLLYGLSFAPITPLLTLILMETPEVGSRHMGAATGMLFCVADIGGFAGPLIIGVIRDLTGSLLTGVYFIAGLSVVMAFMGLFLKARSASGSQSSS
ncbi:CynX/NimT family MFS transporter [Chloroflexota bacterium]